MPGPEFEIPPLLPPPPPEPADPVRPRRRRLAVPALAAVLVALAATGSYRAVSGTSSPPSTTTASTSPTTSTSITTTSITTTTRLDTSGRVCNDGEGEPGPLQGRPAGEATPAITLTFSPRVSGDVLTVIGKALADARGTFGETGTLTVRLYCDLEQYVADSRRPPDDVRSELSEGLVAQVFRGDIWIYGPNYQPLPANERRRVVYHEYFHAVQRQLSQNRSGQRPATPLWLVEGSARYFEYMVEPQDASTFRRIAVRRFAALPALADLEQSGGGIGTGGSGEAYTVGAVASDYLVNTYGRDALQHDFWVALGHTDWRSAFAEVFGTTVDDFYAAFEAYRQTLRP